MQINLVVIVDASDEFESVLSFIADCPIDSDYVWSLRLAVSCGSFVYLRVSPGNNSPTTLKCIFQSISHVNVSYPSLNIERFVDEERFHGRYAKTEVGDGS